MHYARHSKLLQSFQGFEVVVDNQSVRIMRADGGLVDDRRRRICISVLFHDGGEDIEAIDVPIREATPCSEIDWVRAFGRAYRQAKEFAVPSPPGGDWENVDGFTDIVFEGGLGAIALHEACGHGLEADVCDCKSPLSRLVGKRVANAAVTLVDDPTVVGALGSYAVDDEGNAASPTALIQDGRLSLWLGSQRYRPVYDVARSANGRRDSFKNRALPRISNLILRPGRATRAQILERVRRGLLVTSLGIGGESNPFTGTFALSVRNGKHIKKGRAGGNTGAFLIRGESEAFLRGIEMVGRGPRYKPLATLCEKYEQRIFTDAVSPMFLVRNLRVRRLSD
jgi:predicted Zn-dependent protease